MKETVFAVVLCSLLACCNRVSYSAKSWRDPNTTTRFDPFKKILLVAYVKDKQASNYVEKKLAGMLGNRVIAAHQYMDENMVSKTGEIKVRLLTEGFDGAIVVTLVEGDEEWIYDRGDATFPVFYIRFGMFLKNSSGNFRDAGYYSRDRSYSFETNIYSLRPDRLVWLMGIKSGTPSLGTQKTLHEISTMITREIGSQKIIAR